MSRRRPPPDYRDEQIKELKQELSDAREIMREMLPEPIADVLFSYRITDSDDRQRAYGRWRSEALDFIIKQTKPKRDENPYRGPRAYCPLCNDGSQDGGFAYPEGLRRHLTGRGAMRCQVMREMSRQALAYVDEKND
jgi:hypothetical protein